MTAAENAAACVASKPIPMLYILIRDAEYEPDNAALLLFNAKTYIPNAVRVGATVIVFVAADDPPRYIVEFVAFTRLPMKWDSTEPGVLTAGKNPAVYEP